MVHAIKRYLQVHLAEKSQGLTTFITPWGGGWKYLASPIVLSSTEDKYYLRMDADVDAFKKYCNVFGTMEWHLVNQSSTLLNLK